MVPKVFKPYKCDCPWNMFRENTFNRNDTNTEPVKIKEKPHNTVEKLKGDCFKVLGLMKLHIHARFYEISLAVLYLQSITISES